MTKQDIDKLFDEAEKEVCVAFDKCFILVCKLPNGVVLTESVDFIDIEHYDYEMGREITEKKIKNRMYELEMYSKQSALAQEKEINTEGEV